MLTVRWCAVIRVPFRREQPFTQRCVVHLLHDAFSAGKVFLSPSNVREVLAANTQ